MTIYSSEGSVAESQRNVKENYFLLKRFEAHKVEVVLFSTHRDEAPVPSPNEMNHVFIKHIIGDRVVNVCLAQGINNLMGVFCYFYFINIPVFIIGWALRYPYFSD